jgi:hypothetical protein
MKTRLIDLSRPIAFQRSYVTITGSINAALMLSQSVYWTPRSQNPDGWFFKTAEEWESELGLTWEQQKMARKKLIAAGLWEEKRQGATVMLFRVNLAAVEESIRQTLIESESGKAGESIRESLTMNQGKPDNESGKAGFLLRNRDYTETTQRLPETTAKNPVHVVFSYWQEKTKHPGAILDAKRKTAINRALKLGYSIEQLRSAVDGCLKSPWHQGDNDEGKVYDAITLIFRNAEKIEQFIGYNKSPPKPRHEEWKPGRPIYIGGVRVPDHQCDEQTGWVSPEFGRVP